MSSDFSTDLPMLLIGFNRPDLIRRSLAAIRECRPRQLFVAIDGPRTDRPGEAATVDAVANELAAVDWGCDLQVLRQPVNLGCEVGVFTAISWFFDSVAAGLIVEDDILISPDLVRYTEAMLARYADEPTVWMISGYNGLTRWRTRRIDHTFGEPAIWGWATWARCWKQHDPALPTLNDSAARTAAAEIFGDRWPAMSRNVARAVAGEVGTWDYQWSFTVASHGGLCVLPSENLAVNFGFGHPEATHTPRVSAMAPQHLGRWRPLPANPPIAMDRRMQSALHRRAPHDRILSRMIPALELWDRIRPSSYL